MRLRQVKGDELRNVVIFFIAVAAIAYQLRTSRTWCENTRADKPATLF
jgi:hypothetical protein